MQKRKVKYKHNRHLYTYLTRAFTHVSIQHRVNTHAVKYGLDKCDKHKLSNQREHSKYAVLNAKRFINTEYSVRESMTLAQTNLLQTIKKLERRLDTLVYKAGFARTITTAKQMVNHRYVYVNNTILSLPGIKLQPGDVIHVRSFEQNSDTPWMISCAVSSDYVRTPALEVDGVTRTAIYIFHPQQAEYLLP